MTIEILIAIIAVVIISILCYLNKNKKEQIDNLEYSRKSDKDRFDYEISSLTEEVVSGKILLQKNDSKIEKLKIEIVKQAEISQNKYDELYQKYVKLMRAYMIARKKSEIDVINEIEQSILCDYEELGSKNMPAFSYVASAMADFYTMQIKGVEQQLRWMGQISRSDKIADVRNNVAILVGRAKKSQYTFEFALSKILEDHPEINEDYLLEHYGISFDEAPTCARYDEYKISNYTNKISALQAQCAELEDKVRSYEAYKDIRWPLLRDSVLDYQKEFSSNLTAIPYMSRIVADIMTINFDRLAWSLSWGNNQERKKKVASLNALKKEKAEEIERIKGAEYQLAYLLELYPVLQDVIDTEFNDLEISYDEISDYDPVRHYIDVDEWKKLSETERNQLALDRYIEYRKKSKWQVGRDYELYCGYCYEQKGYTVDYFGSYNGLEDLGRDLIVTQNNEVRIVQCKYWSKTKQIHENHIMQLYGSVIEYNLENGQKATGILITNTILSDKAKEFARVLGIAYKENMPIGEFPRIKCNIGVGEFGEKTKIYHLPFDQQYDVTKVDGDGEFMAMTVAEAENSGFRRAYRWHGSE